MRNIFRLFAFAGLALLLASCGATVQEQWDSAQTVYNATMTRLVEARTPCVPSPDNPDFGPDNPRCLISDDLYTKIEPVRLTVDQCLADADGQLRLNNEAAAETYVSCAQGSLAALTAYIIDRN